MKKIIAILIIFTLITGVDYLLVEDVFAAEKEPVTKVMNIAEGESVKVNFGMERNNDTTYFYRIKPKKTGLLTFTCDYARGYSVALCNNSKKVISVADKKKADFLTADSPYKYQRHICYGVKKGVTYLVRVKGSPGARASEDQPYIGTVKWAVKEATSLKYGKSKKAAAKLGKGKIRNGLIISGSTAPQWYKIVTKQKKLSITLISKGTNGKIRAAVYYKANGSWETANMSVARHPNNSKYVGKIKSNKKKKRTIYIKVYPVFKSTGFYTISAK